MADVANLDKNQAIKSAKAAMSVLGLHVVLPLLDVVEFDTRPLYRQRVINEVRDILVADGQLDDPKG